MTGFRIPALRFLLLAPPLLAAADPAARVDSAAPVEPNDPPPVAAAAVEVRQGTLPNPILDPRCSAFRTVHFGDQSENASLPGVFAVHFPAPKISYCWDPVECRLLFVWRGGFLKGDSAIEGELVYVAEGPAPLTASTGAFDPPCFFGYRMVDGAPEFLYTIGLLSVAERIAVAEDGKALEHRFSVQNTPFEVTLAIPERWKDFVALSQGRGTGEFVTIPRDAIADFRLTYRLEKTPLLPELRKDWNLDETRPVAMRPPAARDASAPHETGTGGSRSEAGTATETSSTP